MDVEITFEVLVTAAAIPIAAGIVTSFVALVKMVFPTVDARVSGALMAFIASGALYIVTGFALWQSGSMATANDFLGLFLTWLGVATGSVGIKATSDHIADVRSQ